jgi:polysaccharide deacetylase 2 family uncharacterized protein YibQ
MSHPEKSIIEIIMDAPIAPILGTKIKPPTIETNEDIETTYNIIRSTFREIIEFV